MEFLVMAILQMFILCAYIYVYIFLCFVMALRHANETLIKRLYTKKKHKNETQQQTTNIFHEIFMIS